MKTLSISRPSTRWLATGLAAGLLVASLAGPGIVAAQTDTASADDTLRTINVSGVGRVKAEPDVADIGIGVTQRAKSAKEASTKAAARMDAVIESLLDAGIAENDIQTTRLSLSPMQDWETNPPKVVGWQADNMVNVTVRDTSAVGDVIDAAVGAGANDINGVSFRVEDPSEAQVVARSAAVADAEAKARQLAAETGVEIIGVVTITEGGGYAPEPIYMDRSVAFAAAEAAPSTPVLPGEVELSVSVNIQYEIG